MAAKVLVVEDDPNVRLFIVKALERNGYASLVAKDGFEGMRVLREQMPALLILDILLPGQSGITMYRELKSDEELKAIPVVVCSGVSQKTFLRSQKVLDEFRHIEVPVPEAYLEKPVEAEELIATVRKFV